MAFPRARPMVALGWWTGTQPIGVCAGRYIAWLSASCSKEIAEAAVAGCVVRRRAKIVVILWEVGC